MRKRMGGLTFSARIRPAGFFRPFVRNHPAAEGGPGFPRDFLSPRAGKLSLLHRNKELPRTAVRAGQMRGKKGIGIKNRIAGLMPP